MKSVSGDEWGVCPGAPRAASKPPHTHWTNLLTNLLITLIGGCKEQIGIWWHVLAETCDMLELQRTSLQDARRDECWAQEVGFSFSAIFVWPHSTAVTLVYTCSQSAEDSTPHSGLNKSTKQFIDFHCNISISGGCIWAICKCIRLSTARCQVFCVNDLQLLRGAKRNETPPEMKSLSLSRSV